MTFDELERKSVLIYGFGAEGQATYQFIRERWPRKILAIADQRELAQFDSALQDALQADATCELHLGNSYRDALSDCQVVIKTPGIPAATISDELIRRGNSSAAITSHSALFLANYPRERIIGVTGTKGKSTTTSLIFEILQKAGVDAVLAGNIGAPPLPMLSKATDKTWFVHEFSSHQLAEVEHSPHIAVLLNIVPEHLDYYRDFAAYAAAKENITRFQTQDDYLIFGADHTEPNRIASRSRATAAPFSMAERAQVEAGIGLESIPLLGAFNHENVLAAIAVARLLKIPSETIRRAITDFRPLPHRLEFVGEFKGIRFYDDSIATVPEAALAAIDAFGSDVATLILGGHERNLDYTSFGKSLLARSVQTLIFFPPTGERMWKAVQSHALVGATLPHAFFVNAMEEAVRLAFENTPTGKVCLLSPAAPSFGMFKDYRDRGDSFKELVRKMG